METKYLIKKMKNEYIDKKILPINCYINIVLKQI